MIDGISLTNHSRLCDRLVDVETQLSRTLAKLAAEQSRPSELEARIKEDRRKMVKMMNHILGLENLLASSEEQKQTRLAERGSDNDVVETTRVSGDSLRLLLKWPEC